MKQLHTSYAINAGPTGVWTRARLVFVPTSLTSLSLSVSRLLSRSHAFAYRPLARHTPRTPRLHPFTRNPSSQHNSVLASAGCQQAVTPPIPVTVLASTRSGSGLGLAHPAAVSNHLNGKVTAPCAITRARAVRCASRPPSHHILTAPPIHCPHPPRQHASHTRTRCTSHHNTSARGRRLACTARHVLLH